MIKRVWDRCVEAVGEKNVVVATDDTRILEHCNQQLINVVETSSDCLTGTDRLYDLSKKMEADIYVNVQGDEPLIESADITRILEVALANPENIINAMCPINEVSDFLSSTVPKVVCRPDGRLLYMSRAPIPTDKQHSFVSAMKQVCIYAFPRKMLESFGMAGDKTPLEKIEDIEILRFLEMGYDVKMVEVSGSSVAVDVPADVQRVEAVIKSAEPIV